LGLVHFKVRNQKSVGDRSTGHPSSGLKGGEVFVLTYGQISRSVRFKLLSSSAGPRAALGAASAEIASQRSA
jgi:hypothetical protein